MKQNFRRIISCMLVSVIIFSILPITHVAASKPSNTNTGNITLKQITEQDWAIAFKD